MGKDVSGILKSISKKYKISVSDANTYAAVLSDVIYDAPTASSGELVFSADVPFYQMVFKGYVHMSGENMNVAANPQKQLLKAVESGSSLGYMICAKWDNQFIDNAGYEFFGSEYIGIRDSLIDSYNSLSDYYKAVNGAEITDSQILENGLHKTVFSNGVQVFVNYSDQELYCDMGKVESLGFVWGGALQ